MLRLHPRSLLLALALVAGGAALALDLHAQGDDPLARLLPAERRLLDQRLVDQGQEGLASLPRERQEQLVRNVERLRGLTPAQQALVDRRLGAARAAGLEPRELVEREQAWRSLGDRRPQAEGMGRAIRALGARAWADLPEALRTHPSLAALEASAWPVAFHARFARKAAAAPSDEQVRGWQPAADAPEPWRMEFARARERALADPDTVRGMADLRGRVLLGRMLAAAAPATAPALTPSGGEGGRLALGSRLAGLEPAAYDEVHAEFRGMGEKRGAEGLAALVREAAAGAVRHDAGKQRRMHAMQAVLGLEAAAPWLASQPALAAAADVVLRAALVGELGMPEAAYASLPAREAGEARAQALRAWFQQAAPREWQRVGPGRRLPDRPAPALPGPRRGEGGRDGGSRDGGARER
ncbi:MAG: hypothetical protein ACKOCB_05215 [Planctomycetia bacterium]